MVRHAGIGPGHSLGQNNMAAMPTIPEFYWERQSGGLCRMHALNAYFGAPKLDRVKFEDAIREHDARQLARGYAEMSANDVDVTSTDQKNIIAHILSKIGIFARFFEIGERAAALLKADKYGATFVYSPDHVWLCRRNDRGHWFKIDSLSGISSINLADLEDPRLGLIVPCKHLMDEFNEIAADIAKLIKPDVIDFLVRNMASGNVIGRVETLVGAAVSILEIQLAGRAGYTSVRELFLWYDQFIRAWSGSNCASIKFVLNHIPKIVVRILQISRASSNINHL